MEPSSADDERTVVRPTAARAGRLGHILPNGTRLRDFEITGLIGEGGFGIVYLAHDHSLERRVALKEYMPSSMAARVADGPTVAVRSERHREAFAAGLRSFVNEARLLARFDHPSLVKVYRFWEEHGTAYMVMPYYEGPTLRAALAARAAPPDEATLRAWLRPLLDALEVMHASHCYHRDIAPDNILLTARGPLLLDFGAARHVIGDMTHAITVVLKPGYAPIEQYGDVATMTQGAWTDLYALASVVYYAIEGSTPISSVERLMDDRLVPLSVSATGRYSESFLAAIDAALAVRPADRPQSAHAFRALLEAGLPPESIAAERDSGWSSGYSTLSPQLAPELPTEVDRPRAAPTAPPASGHAARSSEEATLAGAAPRTRRRTIAALALGALLIVAAILGGLQPRVGGPPAPNKAASANVAAGSAEASPTSAPAASPGASASAALVASAPAAAAGPPAVADAPRPGEASAPAIEPAPAPAARVEPAERDSEVAPEAERAAATTSGKASGSAARTARPRREGAPHSDSTAAAPHAAPRTPPAIGSRCSDILQKASLEPLTSSEAEYLKRECR